MRCIIIFEEFYDVQTHWGYFRLDEGAYRDYIAGNLWISWRPGTITASRVATANQPLPPNVTAEAVALRDEVTGHDAYCFFRESFPWAHVEIPFTSKMKNIPISEMALTVRSSNALMRTGVATFGKLWELMNQEHGLIAIRNLGSESESEINHCFFTSCYDLLSQKEKAIYCQKVIDSTRKEALQHGNGM